MTRQHRAGNRARGRMEVRPLRDGKSHRTGGLGRCRGCSADTVDEAQDVRDFRGDVSVHLAQPPVEPGQALAVPRRHRGLDALPEVPREVIHRAFRAPALRPEELAQHGRILGPAVMGVARSGILQCPVDELRNPQFVNPLQVRPERGAAPRGELRDFGDVHRVVKQRGARLGDALVAEREHERRRALRARDHPGADVQTGCAPARECIVHMTQRPDVPARCGDDDELDGVVEVERAQRFDGGDKLGARRCGELLGPDDAGVVAVVVECDVHGNPP